MRQQALVIGVVDFIPISIAQLVLNVHMGFQSSLKVWEVPQTRKGRVGLRWLRICLFPSQPSCIVEGISSCQGASARDYSISQVTIFEGGL
eukprot:249732-Pelagomonas_calceolata.AAC.1